MGGGNLIKKVVKDSLSFGGEVLETTWQTKNIARAGKKIGKEAERFGRSVRSLVKPEIPSLAIPEEEEEEGGKPLVDEEAARLLAQKRRSLERARRGRSSLRIDMPIRNPGVASSIGSGLRIP